MLPWRPDPAPELFPSQVSAGPTPGPETHLPSVRWRFLSLEPPGPLLCRTSLLKPEVSHAPKKMHPSLLFVEGYSLKKKKRKKERKEKKDFFLIFKIKKNFLNLLEYS